MFLLNFLTLFILTDLNLTYGQTDIEDLLEHVKTQLNQPLIPDGISTQTSSKPPYHVNIWDEPPQDFYHPHSFDVYAGHKTELFIRMLYEDNYSAFHHEPALDMLLINEKETKIIITATASNIFVKTFLPTSLFHDYDSPIPHIVSMDYIKYTNFQTGQDEIYIIALQNLQHIQKILTFRFHTDTLIMEYQSMIEIQPEIVKIQFVRIPSAKKNLVFAVRHEDVRKMTSCSSDVFEVSFHENKLILSNLQSLRTSGAIDAESFTINGVSYLAVANSFCPYSDVFVFDVDVNGFYLYQRLQLDNATDFHYFQKGFRHFVATIGLYHSIIFEWKVDNLVPVQLFPSSSSEVMQWHSLQLPWKNEAVLLLVNSNEIQIIKWSKLEKKFVVETTPICTDFLHVPNLIRDRSMQTINSYYDLNFAKQDCIKSRETCVGISQIEDSDGLIKYVPESTHNDLIPVEHGGFTFWFKIFGVGFSCLISNTQFIAPKIISYSHQNLVYVLVPFVTETRVFVFDIRSAQIQDWSSSTSALYHLTVNEDTLNLYDERLDSQINRNIPHNFVTETTEQTLIQPVLFNTTVTALEHLSSDVLRFDFQDGEATLGIWEERFQMLNQKIEDFLKYLEYAVAINSAIVEIPNNIRFTELEVTEKVISRGVADITRINNIPIINLVNTAATWDQREPIYGTKTFIRPITHTGNIRVLNLIADHRFPEDILTTTTNQILDGEWYFDQTIEVENIQVNVLNGINMVQMLSSIHTEETVIYHAPKLFMDRLEIHGDIIVNEISGINLQDLAKHAVTKHGDHIITGRKIFTKNVIVNGHLNVAETINGFDIPLLNSQIVKPNEQAIITAPKFFTQSAFATKNVHVQGLINQEKFPQNFVHQNFEVPITGPKQFSAPLFINGNLNVNGFINEIHVESAVTLYTQQDILDLKVFDNGMDIKDLLIDGTIDGMTMEYLLQIATDEKRLLTSPDYFLSLNVTGDLQNVRYINGFPIAELLKDVVYKNDKNIIFTEEKIFLQSTVIKGEVENLNVINSFNLHTDFLTHKNPQEMIGRKTFTRRITFQDIEIDGLINDVNLTQFFDSVVTLDKAQNIHGIIHFMDGFTIERSLIIDGTIDAVHFPKDILLANESKTIHAEKIFLNGIQTTVLTTNQMHIGGTINTIEWRKFESDRVTLSTPQTIFSTMTFLDEVKIKENLEIVSRINEVDVIQLTNDAMMKSKPQTITGIKTILGEVSADYIVTGSFGGLSGVNFTELDITVIRFHDNKPGQKLYFDEVEVTETVLLGTLNEKIFEEIINDTVIKSSDIDQNITGVKTFLETITITGNLDVATINGLNPLTDFLLKTPLQIIPGSFDLQNVIVLSDITVDGKINGINLTEFKKQVIKINEDITLSVLTLENDVFIDKNLNIIETINGIDLPLVLMNSVSKNGPIRIKSYKEFTGTLKVFGNVTVEDRVNDIKLSNFVKDVVLITEANEIEGIKTFTSEVEVSKSIQITGNLTVTGTINTINLNHLFNSTFYPNEPHLITGNKIFIRPVTIENNVEFKTRINHIKLPVDVVLINGNQAIHGTKRFEHIIIRGDMKVRHANGHILEDLYQDTVFIPNHRPITGLKIIKKKTTFKTDVIVVGNACGINFHDNVLTKDRIQTVKGVKTFHNMQVIGNIQINNLNGYPLNLSSSLWDISQSVDIHHQFLGETIFMNVELEIDEIDEVSLPSIDVEIQTLETTINQLQIRSNIAIESCSSFDKIISPIREVPEKLVHFELSYVTDVIGDEFEIIQNGDQVYLLLKEYNEPCQPHYIYFWNFEGGFTNLHIEVAKGNSVQWKSFVHKNEQYLILAQPNPSKCGTPSLIYRLNTYPETFTLYCKLDNFWFKQFSTIHDGTTLFIAMIPNFQIFILDLNNLSPYCRIFPTGANYTTDGYILTAVGNMFVVVNSKGIYFYNPISPKILVNHFFMPGIKHFVSSKTNGREFLIIGKKLDVTSLHIVQVYELVDGFDLLLLQQTSPVNRPILDIKLFSWGPNNEIHIVVLYDKIGISIIKLEGYETFDKMNLPIPTAKRFNVFTWNQRPYLLLSPVGRKQEIHVYSGIIKGVNSRTNMTCLP